MKDSHLRRLLWIAAAAMTVSASAMAASPPTQRVAKSAGKPAVDLPADTSWLLPGAFTPDLSLEDLRRRFGTDNVKVEEILAIEETIQGIVLFPDDPLHRVEIFTRDPTTLRGIAGIRVSGSKSRWHLDNGFHLGMTLAELVKANGKPITYYGLAWDYGGIVTDWHGGRLAQREDIPIHRSIGLSSADSAGVDAVPLGEGKFRSDDPRYPLQGKLVIVGELIVSFAEPERK